MTQAAERQNQIEILNITPENIIAGVRELLHEAAKQVLDSHIAKLTEWIQQKLKIINSAHENKITSVLLQLNAYNETAGLGIQSVSVGFRNGSEELRPTAEFKDATIGVVADGLLENKNAPWVLASFEVDAGNAEILHPSKELRFDESNPNGDYQLPQKGAPVFFVKGPNSARTVVQKAKVSAGDKVVDENNRGVYACEYVRVGK